MEFKFDPEHLAFREKARTWLEENVPKEKRPPTGPDARAFDLAWQKRQYDGGWAGVAWPADAGGLGLSLLHQLIWHEEYARASAPPPGVLFIALNHAGPTLIVRGSEEQKRDHLPKILSGQEVWCQGFSEPGSGSDLASLTTRGEIDGNDLVVNGSKIWTSIGHLADSQELLIRTDPNSQRHGGLTWVICDMHLPGITIQKIKTITEDIYFCQVFYDNVRIPLNKVVGEVNGGWSVAMATLALERGVAMIPHQMELAIRLEKLIELAREHLGPDGRRTAIEHEAISAELAACRADVAALRALTYLSMSRGLRQELPGPEGTIVALRHSELLQRIQRVAAEVLGADLLDYGGPLQKWAWNYLDSFKYTIAGGTAEVRRNIIAERVLGLPRGR